MKNTISLLKAAVLGTLCIQCCATSEPAPPPPPPPPPIQLPMKPVAISQAKIEFRNFRQAMGYTDNKSGYFDISAETLRALQDEAMAKGWTNIRVYHGIDNTGKPTLLVNGLVINGNRLEETGKIDGDMVVKIESPSILSGSDCPRWCDIAGTVIGK